MKPLLRCGRFELGLERPLIMGIVNVTPDSFSDGRADFSVSRSIKHAYQLIDEGADMLDIGGESTRPGANSVPEEDEINRVVPVIKELINCNIPLSVDTYKPNVMRKALEAGADMINDVTAFMNPESISVVAPSNCGICIMHMQGEPRTMQSAPVYKDLVGEINAFLLNRRKSLQDSGVDISRIVLDPGFGFGKTVKQNYELLRSMPTAVSGLTWLLGVSRKSMLGHLTGREPNQRVAASIAAALAGIKRGANIVRVHDVQETADALRVWQAIEDGSFL